MNLLEAYKKRLAVAESIHQRSHDGAKMSPQKKLMLAAVLDNTAKFLNENYVAPQGATQSPLGDYKKFCLNIANVSLPNLILPELMLTQPMTSFSGFVTYLKYTSGTAKGGVKVDDVFNTPYSHGVMTEDRMRYTSAAVVEEFAQADGISTEIKLNWTPIKSVHKVIKIKADTPDTILETPTDYSIDDATITLTSSLQDGEKVKVLYFYDNVEIPQKNQVTSLPTLKASMVGIPLRAHARRIAIYYSQMSAYQSKTDYGIDLGDQLAQQAQAELQYEIDSEGVALLANGAEEDKRLIFKDYGIANPGTISRSQYYEGFSQIIARARAIMYQRTQKFNPTYMVVGSDVLTILPFLKGWTPASSTVAVNGPYFAGTVEGLKVYVHPAMTSNEFFFGVNGGDLQTSAGVYAPYMAIVPTQLLGFADGTMSQGFSTLYDMRLLSTYRGEIGNRTAVDADDATEDQGDVHSYLLVKGHIIFSNTDSGELSGINYDDDIALPVWVTNAEDFKTN